MAHTYCRKLLQGRYEEQLEEKARRCGRSLLPDKYRIILYLYYYEGYTLKEISHILKVNDSTLRSRFAAAKKKMKEYLEND